MSDPVDHVLMSDSLRNTNAVLVDLLRTLPTDLDVATWDKLLWPGYESRLGSMTLLGDNPPEAMAFEVRAFFDVATFQPIIPFFGVSLYGKGIAIGEVLDSANQPLINYQGFLPLSLTILYQSYIPGV